jgi:hypothetical protein
MALYVIFHPSESNRTRKEAEIGKENYNKTVSQLSSININIGFFTVPFS